MRKDTGEDKFENLIENQDPGDTPEVITDGLFGDDGFFDPSDIAQVKYEMLRCVANGQSVAEAIRAFGFSSQHSFYKARAAFKRRGLAGLVPIKRGPKKNLANDVVPAVLSRPPDEAQSSGTPLADKFVSDDIEIDFVMRRVRAGTKKMRLTPKEFDLLRYLVSNIGKPIPHRELLTAVWGPQSADQIDYLRVFITYLRKKIEPDPAKPRYILTEPWVGYRFME